MIVSGIRSWFQPKAQSDEDAPGYIADGLTKWVPAGTLSRRTLSGERISAENASTLADVHTCIAIRSMSLASFPLQLWQRQTPKGNIQGSKRIFNDNLAYILDSQPNPLMSRFNFYQTMQKAVDLYGNAYALIVRDGNYAVQGLYPLHPTRVTPEIVGESLRYKVRIANTQKHEYLLADEMLHIRQDTDDGVTGISKVQLLCEELGIVKATRSYTATYFANGPTPGGIIKLGKQKPTDSNEIEDIREQWRSRYTGGNRHKVAVLYGGAEFEALSIQNDHAQLLQFAEHNRRVIASIFRVPSFMLNDPNGFAYNSTVESGKNLEKHTFREIASAWEHELNIKLFLDKPDDLYARFDLSELSRTDRGARATTAKDLHLAGLADQDEARDMADLPPAREDQEFVANINNVGPLPKGNDTPQKAETPVRRACNFGAQCSRYVWTHKDKFKAWVDEHQTELAAYAVETLTPIKGTCAALGIQSPDLDELATRYATSSKGQLSAVLRKAGYEALDGCVAEWAATRAQACTAAALEYIPQTTTTVEQSPIEAATDTSQRTRTTGNGERTSTDCECARTTSNDHQ